MTWVNSLFHVVVLLLVRSGGPKNTGFVYAIDSPPDAQTIYEVSIQSWVRHVRRIGVDIKGDQH